MTGTVTPEKIKLTIDGMVIEGDLYSIQKFLDVMHDMKKTQKLQTALNDAEADYKEYKLKYEQVLKQYEALYRIIKYAERIYLSSSFVSFGRVDEYLSKMLDFVITTNKQVDFICEKSFNGCDLIVLKDDNITTALQRYEKSLSKEIVTPVGGGYKTGK